MVQLVQFAKDLLNSILLLWLVTAVIRVSLRHTRTGRAILYATRKTVKLMRFTFRFGKMVAKECLEMSKEFSRTYRRYMVRYAGSRAA